MNIFFAVLVLILLALGFSLGAPSSVSLPSSSTPSSTPSTPTTNTNANVNTTGVDMYSSDSSITGSPITQDPSTWPNDDPYWMICCAVATAEGYDDGDGAAPYDLNNPGDLSPGDEAGQSTCGGAQQHGGSAIIVFCTAEGGWRALYTKFSNIANGRSTVYPATWTWQQVSAKYAGNSVAWLNNVTAFLGVDPSTTPAQYVQNNS
jgi:hypothetical protein